MTYPKLPVGAAVTVEHPDGRRWHGVVKNPEPFPGLSWVSVDVDDEAKLFPRAMVRQTGPVYPVG